MFPVSIRNASPGNKKRYPVFALFYRVLGPILVDILPNQLGMLRIFFTLLFWGGVSTCSGLFAQGLDWRIELGLGTAGMQMSEPEVPGGIHLDHWLGEVVSSGITLSPRKTSTWYAGMRAGFLRPRMGTYLLRQNLMDFEAIRFEVPVGYQRSINISDRYKLLTGIGLSLDLYPFGGDSVRESYSDLIIVRFPGQANLLYEGEGWWKRDRSVSGAAEIWWQLERRIRNGNSFFWGGRLHLGLQQVYSGGYSHYENKLLEDRRTLFSRGGSFTFNAGFTLGRSESNEIPGEKDRRHAARPGNRTFFAELGGSGLLYGVHFDRRFYPFQEGRGSAAARVGLSVGPDGAVILPLGVSYLTGEGKSHFEVGPALTLLVAGWQDEVVNRWPSRSYIDVFPTVQAGYRLQKAEGGFFFRAITQVMYRVNSGSLEPWGGIGLGYSLKK